MYLCKKIKLARIYANNLVQKLSRFFSGLGEEINVTDVERGKIERERKRGTKMLVGVERLNNQFYWRVHRLSQATTRNTNDDNWQQHDNGENGKPACRAERVRQRVSFIQAANFTRADTCALHSSHCKPGFMPFRRHSSLYFTLLHFLLRFPRGI